MESKNWVHITYLQSMNWVIDTEDKRDYQGGKG